MGSTPGLQELVDAVPPGGRFACIPNHETIAIYYDEKELGNIPLDHVTDVSLLVDSSVQKNYTILRTLLLGPLVLLFPKKTVKETYRLCIQWISTREDYNFTYVPIPSKTVADFTLNSIKRLLDPEVRSKLAQKAAKTNERAIIKKKNEQPSNPSDESPFITCVNCTMEFKKSDLPSGDKCPVCDQSLTLKG